MSTTIAKLSLLALAMGLLAWPNTTTASVIAPISHGAWLSLREFPAAINAGNYESVELRFSADSVVIQDDDNIRARGPTQIVAYLKEWYGINNHVTSIYPGAHTVMFFVERNAVFDRPWDKAYVMIVSFHGDEDIVHSITIIPHNPTVPDSILHP